MERRVLFRKETVAVLVILGLAIPSAIAVWVVVWFFALPTNVKPIQFPQVMTAEILIGPERALRVLTPEETEHLQDWLQQHTKGWGLVVSRSTPSSGDALIIVNSHLPEQSAANAGRPVKSIENEKRFSLRIWDGINMGDWNKTIIIEWDDGKPVRKKVFSKKDFAFIRSLLDGYHYQRSVFP